MTIKTTLERYQSLLPTTDLRTIGCNLYLKVYLYMAFVGEYNFHEKEAIDVGTQLQIVKTKEENYAIYLGNEKLSTLPTNFRNILSVILDADLMEIHAEITHYRQNAHPAEKLHYAVYTFKKINANTDLTLLEKWAVCSPDYRLLQSELDAEIARNYDLLKALENEKYFYAKLPIELFNAHLTILFHSYSSIIELEKQLDLSGEIVFEEWPSDLKPHDVFADLYYYKSGTIAGIDLNQNYIFAVNINFLRSPFFSPKHIYETIGKTGQKYYDVVYGK